MSRAATLLALTLVLVPDAPAGAQTTCRASALGSVVCPVKAPPPRQPYQADTQALDRVRREATPPAGPPVLVPARRTNRLGSTRVDAARPVGRCRPDRLGNLLCP
jgi:hypothetical protein